MRRILAPAAAVVATALTVGGWTSPASASSDPAFSRQWALTQIRAPEAWTRSTGAGVTIGIVDTGVDIAHEDLGGRVVAQTNCVGAGPSGACSGSGQDDNGHGTYVAGIAAASTGNNKGVAGVAPGASLVVAKVLNHDAAGSVDDIVAGIRWAVDHDARVVNVSISDGAGATAAAASALHDSLEYAWSRGAIPVVAAGNSDYGGTNAIVVASTTASGSPAPQSGHLGTAKWGVLAPGGSPPACQQTRNSTDCVFSTAWAPGQHDAYQNAAGPSAAAPHVAGVAAQLLSTGLGQQAVVDRLLATADHRRLDAAAALGVPRAAATPAAVATPSKAPASTSSTAPPARRAAARRSGPAARTAGDSHTAATAVTTTTADAAPAVDAPPTTAAGERFQMAATDLVAAPIRSTATAPSDSASMALRLAGLIAVAPAAAATGWFSRRARHG